MDMVIYIYSLRPATCSYPNVLFSHVVPGESKNVSLFDAL